MIFSTIILCTLSTFAGGLIGYVIGSLIGENEVREVLRKDGAFYGKIKELQPKTMTIEEIDEDGDTLQNVQLESEAGISDGFYEGEVIFAFE